MNQIQKPDFSIDLYISIELKMVVEIRSAVKNDMTAVFEMIQVSFGELSTKTYSFYRAHH